jgi:putative transposase
MCIIRNSGHGRAKFPGTQVTPWSRCRKEHYDPLNLATLEGRSHHPRRQPTWSLRFADRVLALRQRYPRWGKDKLAVLLRQRQIQVSTSMVGRILTQLKRQCRLIEPPRSGGSGSRRALRPRPYAVRKPKQYAASRPGDLVQVDTLDVRPLPGVVFKQFTARDVVSRWM